MEKQTARQLIKRLRTEYLPKHPAYSDIIVKKLIRSTAFMGFESYFIYYGTEEEVFTKPLIDFLLSVGKKVYCPCTGSEIYPVEVTKTTEFKKAAFDILEPIGEPFSGHIDIAVVPMLAFDAWCNRLGHGKGYYDAFLMNFEGFKLGLAFSYQLLENIDVSVYDIPMDAVLTEDGYYARYQR